MTLPVVIPNEFANATASIPLSQLDSNFSTLANVVNEINAGTQQLSNANVVTLIVTGNATIGDASSNTVTLNSTLTANTAVIFSAGTSAAPAITTTGDTNTGIFFPAADTIAFAEGGAEAMRIDSSGRVGIGTTSPSQKLHVAGVIRAESGNTSGGALIVTRNADSVGAIAPVSSWLGTGSSADLAIAAYGSPGGNITFYTNGTDTERMRIDSSGNVGIGVTDPSTSTNNIRGLVLGGSNQAQLRLQSSNTGYTNTDGFLISINNASPSDGFVYNYENANIIFGTNDTERARITSGGYFKASNTGSYANSGLYHEFYQTNNNLCLASSATNASFTEPVIFANAHRSANSAYFFFDAYSGNGTDLEFRLRGDGNGYADGTWNNNGADYAEFFESANGQALTLGATVVLDGNKVREATDQDPATSIIGVVRPKEPSKASMIVGNTAWNKWANKYLTDDFDRFIMEDHDVVEWEEQVLEREATEAVEAVVDEEGVEIEPAVPAQEAVYKTVSHSYESHNIPAGVTVPADATRKTHDENGVKFQHYKLNPAWNPDSEYVNRENRPEWNIIGLLGQVKILKGQPVGDRWIKMRDVSETVEEWMIR